MTINPNFDSDYDNGDVVVDMIEFEDGDSDDFNDFDDDCYYYMSITHRFDAVQW
jgi:hypothetical protein